MSQSILSESFINKYRNKKVPWGFGQVSYVTYKRTYARVMENGQKEEWVDTLVRCINGAQKIGADYTTQEAERLFDHMFNLRCSFSGRSLWQLGTKTVDLIGADSLLNCWVTKLSSIDDFVFIFTESMLGGGVGVNVSKEYTQELPRVKKGVKCELKNTKDADFIVPDSKEGWAQLWRKLFEAYLVTGKSFTYSMCCIRPKGEPLKTFGGIAPGPEPLISGAAELCRIMEQRAGKKLRTQDVCDLICVGGQVVKSGGIRRTALILLGDVDDAAFLNLKRWDLDPLLPAYRGNSNNSCLTSKISYVGEKFWEGYKGNGEAYGLCNLHNSRRFGRAGETEINGFKLYDDSIIGLNPCAEACLADKENCNLAEIMLNNVESKEQMLDCAILLYKTQKAIAACNYLHEETNDIVHKNMRLGLGVTGVCQRTNDYEEWCDYVYTNLRKFDAEYSKAKNWPISIRLTVVKPSGTLSLLSGSTPGANPGYSHYFMRTIRFAANDPLLIKLKEAHYRMEPEIQLNGSINHDIMVVYFPSKFSENTLCEKDSNCLDQLERIKKLQTCWADQAVSNTVYFRKGDVPMIREWLEKNYDDHVKSVSFLPFFEHGFKQAPLSPITKEEYEKEISKIDLSIFEDKGESELLDSQECAGGHCPLK